MAQANPEALLQAAYEELGFAEGTLLPASERPEGAAADAGSRRVTGLRLRRRLVRRRSSSRDNTRWLSLRGSQA